MRKGLLFIGLILLLIALLIGFGRVTGLLNDEPPPEPPTLVPDLADSPIDPPAEPPPTPSGGDEDEPEVLAPGAGGFKVALPPADREPAAVPVAPPPADADAPPAFRPNPRTPPPPKPGSRSIGGRRPPMGPTGLWERFPPEIPRGTASIRVLVLDRDGVPVPGADVWLGPPTMVGSRAVSFGDLRKAGVTDTRGIVVGENLPAGSAAVAGNVGNLLNGRGGLDASSAVRTVLWAKETVDAEVRLPIALGDFGTIVGTVSGPDEKPLRSVSVTSGFNRARTGADGAYTMRFVPVGTASVSVSRNGYVTVTDRLTIKAGGSEQLDVRLEFREEGSLSLRGTVVGPDGAAVPGALVYVIAKSGRGGGTVRSGLTDEHGQFDFPSLPDRLADADVRIQANRQGYRAGNVMLPDGLHQSEVEVRLPLQLTRLELTVVDSASGTPQTRCRFRALREGAERPAASFSSRAPDGVYETWLEPGKLTFVVEAPNHETLTATVDVPAGGGRFPYIARLVGYGEESTEVILVVRLLSAVTGDPIENADIQIIGPDRKTPLAGLKGMRPGGEFTIPVPSGNVEVRVQATGFELHTEPLKLPPSPRDATLELRLSPE